MKPTQAALCAVLVLASACATQRSQTREPASTAQAKPEDRAKPDEQPGKEAQEKKKKPKSEEKLVCEWVEPDIGSRVPQKVCHPANELHSERSEEPQAPADSLLPLPPGIQTNHTLMNGPG